MDDDSIIDICSHHQFKVRGRTFTGWQYIMQCRVCGLTLYPRLQMFGATRSTSPTR